jgi:aspartate ammonia-lyase
MTGRQAKKFKEGRTERDGLGVRRLPGNAYYGIQTVRASENFPISRIPPKAGFIRATAMVKLAAGEANVSLGLLDKRRGRAISRAAGEVISGKLHEDFIVDVYQAGAGTSHNMNANEVLARRAMELAGGAVSIHPNDHVNMSQSTNDTFPTAMRIAAVAASAGLIINLKSLKKVLAQKSKEFDRIIKSGRTHLQDAVPVRLGQEFGSWAASIDSAIARLVSAQKGLCRIGLGATAAGTGINTHPGYRSRVLRELKRVSGLKGLKRAPDTFEALSSMADFTSFSGAMKDLAVELIRISNDLRLLSSGPTTGLSEIRLPAVQPGSSIMPGKVNPVMAEMLAMVSFQVIGNDLAVTMAAQAGQLELNVMGPVINYNILQSIEILTNSIEVFTERCVKGITADRLRCRDYFLNSMGLATALNTIIGYERAAEVAKEAALSGKGVREVVIERGMVTGRQFDKLIARTGPTRIARPAGRVKR